MDKVQFLLGVSMVLFALGLTGVIIRRNLLVMLMCMELMLNGVNLSLVTFSSQMGNAVGSVLVSSCSWSRRPKSPSRSRSSCCWRGASGRWIPRRTRT